MESNRKVFFFIYLLFIVVFIVYFVCLISIFAYRFNGLDLFWQFDFSSLNVIAFFCYLAVPIVLFCTNSWLEAGVTQTLQFPLYKYVACVSLKSYSWSAGYFFPFVFLLTQYGMDCMIWSLVEARNSLLYPRICLRFLHNEVVLTVFHSFRIFVFIFIVLYLS